MIKLPRPLIKLDCLNLKMNLTARIEDIQSRMNSISNACNELKTSQKMRLLFEAILMLGNILNTQNEDVNKIVIVKSFTVTSLASLSGTKGYDKKTSLLMFLERILDEKLPSVFSV